MTEKLIIPYLILCGMLWSCNLEIITPIKVSDPNPNQDLETTPFDSSTLVPIVYSIEPLAGPKNVEVSIYGERFSPQMAGNIVRVNGNVVEVKKFSDTLLVVKIPPGTGSGQVEVSTDGRAAMTAPVFTYQWTVSTLAGTGEAGFLNGPGSVSQLKNPYGVAVDADNNVYVGDMINNRIRKISPSGTVTTLAGSGAQGYADGASSSAMFYAPYGVAVDGDGYVYVADLGNQRIRKIASNGEVSTWAGSGNGAYKDGHRLGASFYYPQGVAVDANGNVFVADTYNHRIRKIKTSGQVSTLAGSGEEGYLDGELLEASFNDPGGIVVDRIGNVIVSDRDNHRIRKISPSGGVSTLAGTGIAGFANGNSWEAKFNYPGGLGIDKNGNVYVADMVNHRIRMITPEGVVSTLAGTGEAGSTNGSALQAKINGPSDVSVGNDGVIYVAENSGHRVLKID